MKHYPTSASVHNWWKLQFFSCPNQIIQHFCDSIKQFIYRKHAHSPSPVWSEQLFKSLERTGMAKRYSLVVLPHNMSEALFTVLLGCFLNQQQLSWKRNGKMAGSLCVCSATRWCCSWNWNIRWCCLRQLKNLKRPRVECHFSRYSAKGTASRSSLLVLPHDSKLKYPLMLCVPQQLEEAKSGVPL